MKKQGFRGCKTVCENENEEMDESSSVLQGMKEEENVWNWDGCMCMCGNSEQLSSLGNVRRKFYINYIILVFSISRLGFMPPNNYVIVDITTMWPVDQDAFIASLREDPNWSSTPSILMSTSSESSEAAGPSSVTMNPDQTDHHTHRSLWENDRPASQATTSWWYWMQIWASSQFQVEEHPCRSQSQNHKRTSLRLTAHSRSSTMDTSSTFLNEVSCCPDSSLRMLRVLAGRHIIREKLGQRDNWSWVRAIPCQTRAARATGEQSRRQRDSQTHGRSDRACDWKSSAREP